jgi:hypothetical protein
VGSPDAAQAVEFIRALCAKRDEMAHQLAWVEQRTVNSAGSRASAMRSEAAALRGDINEANILINRLQRRYHVGEERTLPRGDSQT